jgi:hypothetical protein
MTAEVKIKVLQRNPVIKDDITITVPDYTGRKTESDMSRADLKVFGQVGIGLIDTDPGETFVGLDLSKGGRLWLFEDRTTIKYGDGTEVDSYGTKAVAIPDGVTLSYELHDGRKKYAVPVVVVEVIHMRGTEGR